MLTIESSMKVLCHLRTKGGHLFLSNTTTGINQLKLQIFLIQESNKSINDSKTNVLCFNIKL